MAGAWELAKDTVNGFIEDEALSHGASIAYYTLFAVAPVLLIIIAIAGVVFVHDAAQAAIVAQLGGMMGESTGKALEENDCHVPENPNRLKRLVLLQTQAHAAWEIKRLMKSVRDNEMPVDDALDYREIDAGTKETLLRYGAAFEVLIDAARNSEEAHARPR